MTIDAVTELFDDAAADNEQRFVRAVAAGEVDLGWVGTRAFAELGVTSLEALTAPFLVDSYALQAAILDSDLPERMLGAFFGTTGLTPVVGTRSLTECGLAGKPLVEGLRPEAGVWAW